MIKLGTMVHFSHETQGLGELKTAFENVKKYGLPTCQLCCWEQIHRRKRGGYPRNRKGNGRGNFRALVRLGSCPHVGFHRRIPHHRAGTHRLPRAPRAKFKRRIRFRKKNRREIRGYARGISARKSENGRIYRRGGSHTRSRPALQRKRAVFLI